MILSLLIGLGAAGGAFYYLKTYQLDRVEYENVTVAARQIPVRTIVQESDLRSEKVIKGGRLKNSIQEPHNLIGKITLTTILEGEQIHRDKVTSLESVIEPYERLVAVPIDDPVQCVGNTIEEGDIVDVILQTSTEKPPIILASGIRVYELRSKDGQSIKKPSQGDMGIVAGMVQDVASSSSIQIVPGSIVLVVHEDQAALFANSIVGGKVYFIKRDNTLEPQKPKNVVDFTEEELAQQSEAEMTGGASNG